MSSADLLALAERVEAASGPDRELDYAINRIALKRYVGVGKYTASLDAAMTLVPEGPWLLRGPTKDALVDPTKCFARIESIDFKSVTWGKGSDWITDVVSGNAAQAIAATPALALTAACLKARASQEPDNAG